MKRTYYYNDTDYKLHTVIHMPILEYGHLERGSNSLYYTYFHDLSE